MQTLQKKQTDFLMTCDKCGHAKVCTIVKAVTPLLETNWTDDTRPFEVSQIAAICKEYLDLTNYIGAKGL